MSLYPLRGARGVGLLRRYAKNRYDMVCGVTTAQGAQFVM